MCEFLIKLKNQIILACCASLFVASSAWAANEALDPMEQAKINFGRVLQDPLANFRGIITENSFMGNSGIDDELAFVSSVQGIYAMQLPQYGINLTPRVVLPVVGVPPLSNLPPLLGDSQDFSSTKWGISDTIVQAFVSEADSDSRIKWGVGPQFSLKTHSDPVLEAAGWGGGLGGVVVADAGQWGLTGIVAHMSGFQNDFNTTLVRPFISYNFKSIPGFAISSSPAITYDWNARSGDAWSIPLGAGVTQAIPLSPTKALLVGLGGYHYVRSPEFGPEYSIKITFAFMSAPDSTKR